LTSAASFQRHVSHGSRTSSCGIGRAPMESSFLSTKNWGMEEDSFSSIQGLGLVNIEPLAATSTSGAGVHPSVHSQLRTVTTSSDRPDMRPRQASIPTSVSTLVFTRTCTQSKDVENQEHTINNFFLKYILTIFNFIPSSLLLFLFLFSISVTQVGHQEARRLPHWKYSRLVSLLPWNLECLEPLAH